MDPAATGYDLTETCPKAKWDVGEQRSDFGIPGMPTCAMVVNDAPTGHLYYGWLYVVHCPLLNAHRSSRRNDRDPCQQEAEMWLASIKCPGEIRTDPNRHD